MIVIVSQLMKNNCRKVVKKPYFVVIFTVSNFTHLSQTVDRSLPSGFHYVSQGTSEITRFSLIQGICFKG